MIPLAEHGVSLEDLALYEVSTAIVHSVTDAAAIHAGDVAVIEGDLDKGAGGSLEHGISLFPLIRPDGLSAVTIRPDQRMNEAHRVVDSFIQ